MEVYRHQFSNITHKLGLTHVSEFELVSNRGNSWMPEFISKQQRPESTQVNTTMIFISLPPTFISSTFLFPSSKKKIARI